PVTRSLSRCAASAESSTTAGVAGSVVTTGATLGAELGSAAVRGAGSTRGPQAKRRTSVVANVVKGSLLAHGITRTVASCRGVCQANRLTTQIAAVVSPMELLYTESPEAIGSHAHFCAPRAGQTRPDSGEHGGLVRPHERTNGLAAHGPGRLRGPQRRARARSRASAIHHLYEPARAGPHHGHDSRRGPSGVDLGRARLERDRLR